VGTPDLILSDEYNHSSLINGARLSGATLVTYRHGDVAHLQKLLVRNRPHYRRCLLLTDSVFSMDGDLCPLPDLLTLAEAHQAMVLVDEAHGTGVLGKQGAGCVEHFGCTGQPIIQMGTLSKALGSLGGYVTGDARLIDFLRNRAATWIYTTGLSPADTAAALAAIQLLQQQPERRRQLWQNVAYLKTQLASALATTGLTLLPSESPILCVEYPSAKAVLQVGQRLQNQGLWVAAVRPPTVPTSRLRMTVMATHQLHQLDLLVNALASIAAEG
jgi:8-amino-7-oxononanoate synthase